MADALHHQAHLTHRTSRTLEVLCGKWKRAQQLLYRNSQHNGVASAKLAEEINIVILLSEQSFTLKNFFFCPRQGDFIWKSMTGASQSFDNCIYLFKSSSSNIFFFSYPRQSKAKCVYAQL